MHGFIKSLVYKAYGSGLTTKLNPSIGIGNEIFFQNHITRREKLSTEHSQKLSLNSIEKITPSVSISNKLPADVNNKCNTSSELTFKSQFIKTGNDITKKDHQEDFPKLENQRKKNAVSAEYNDEVTIKSSDPQKTIEFQLLKVNRIEKPIREKSKEQSNKLNSENEVENKSGFQISPDLQIVDQTNISNKLFKSKLEPDELVDELRLRQPSVNKSQFSQKSNTKIVHLEPVPVETQQQDVFKELLNKTKSSIDSSAESNEMKSAQVQSQKEVRVNIGKVEIKASPLNLPQVKSLTRGFEEYIIIRNYLDRHYF